MKVIDVHDLDKKDAELVETLVKSLRAKTKAAFAARAKASGFTRSAGSWKGLINPDELIADLYARRTLSSRPEVKL